MSGSRLFEPVKVGPIELKHRIAMAPLTRFRASDDHVILPMATQYYSQRASVPGTFLLTEATIISKAHGGYPNSPGIYNQDQINAWKKITEEVHKKGCFIFCQLWALGRAADKSFAEASGFTVKSSSATQLDDKHAVPVEMTQEDINNTIATYAQAARNAMAAGFDGIEIHSANGYLIDQFNQEVCNKRTDSYGGSIENRSRFALEVVQAVVDVVGADKTAIRFSPFSTFNGMKQGDTIPQFTDILQKLNKLNLAYVHLVEARMAGIEDSEGTESLNPLLAHYTSGPVFVAGGLKPDIAKALVEEHKDRDLIVVFGRYFLANPDLVYRLQHGIELNQYDRSTFYTAKSEIGYTDYPFSKEFEQAKANL